MTGYVTGAPGAAGAVPAPKAALPAAATGAAREARKGGRGKAADARRARRQGREQGLRAAAEAVPAEPPAAAAEPVRPRADCTADAAGGLTFDVRAGAWAGDAQPPPGEAALLLRLRGGAGPEEAVRLPLGPVEDAGALRRFAEGAAMRAVLPSTMSLAEGRWDVYLDLPGREPVRLLPGVHDLRSLIGRAPSSGRAWLGVRIPYATKFGNLSIRSWLRWPHAEAGSVCVADGSMVLRGRLYGARLSPAARLEAHPRGTAGPPVSVPLLPDGEAAAGKDGRCGGSSAGPGAEDPGGNGPSGDRQDGSLGTGPHPGGRRTDAAAGAEPAPGFAAALPLDALPPGERVWDLWLRPAADEEPARIARILDDIADKKHIFSYPPQTAAGEGGAVHSVRPYYTLDNDLSVRVSCAEAV